jgi:hypothetical protein
MVVFEGPQITWQLTPDWLSSTETRGNAWLKSWKKHLSEWAHCHNKAIGCIHSTKTWRAQNLQPSSKFDNSKPKLKSDMSSRYISWLNVSLFGVGDCGFLKKEFKTYVMALTSLHKSPIFFSVFTPYVQVLGAYCTVLCTRYSWLETRHFPWRPNSLCSRLTVIQ